MPKSRSSQAICGKRFSISARASLLVEFLPEFERALRPARVNFVRAVAHADDSRFARRTGAAVGCAIRVGEKHSGSAAREAVRRPRAENARTDDDGVMGLRFSHGKQAGCKRARRSSRLKSFLD